MFPKEYSLIKDKEIPEINTHAYLLQHKKTKAEIIYLKSDDTNKTFGIAFNTLSEDSTGVAHILEHCVLDGSRKYPVKDPFGYMNSSSLRTFLNAMTGPDVTFYPVSSENDKDLSNLMDVYLDAVFFPLLREETFKRQGWRYSWDEKSKELSYSGIVFNETKGVLGDVREIMSFSVGKNLFPDNLYAYNFGGDPEEIPSLSHKAFVAFHKKFYHPSNSRSFLYGNLDINAALKHLDKYFSQFDYKKISAKIIPQKPFTKPKLFKEKYPVGKEGPDNGILLRAWAFSPDRDPEIKLGMEILTYMLCHSDASPLRKKILDLKLGKDIVGLGYSSFELQPNFTTGVKGAKPEDFKLIGKVIEETLRELSKGIDKENVVGALNRMEFDLRESDAHEGVNYLFELVGGWIADEDPFEALEFEAALNSIKTKVKNGEGFFESLIKTYLLDNNHSVTIELYPDTEFISKKNKEEVARLKKVQKSLTSARLNKLIDSIKEFEEWQGAGDSKSDLAKLPKLKISDLRKEIKKVDSRISKIGNVDIQVNEVDTKGIIYWAFCFDFLGIDKSLIPYIRIYNQYLRKGGTLKHSYTELSTLFEKTTGGIKVIDYLATNFKTREPVAKTLISSKATKDNLVPALAVIEEMLLSPNFNNKERLRQILSTEEKSFSDSLTEKGHVRVLLRALASKSYTAKLTDSIGGLEYYLYLRELTRDFDNRFEEVVSALQQIHKYVVNVNKCTVNLTCSKEHEADALEALGKFLKKLPVSPVQKNRASFRETTVREAFITSSRVNYVGAAGVLKEAEVGGEVEVIESILSDKYLYDEVRVKGGAYGAGCNIKKLEGIIAFTSYRDPNIDQTLEVYKNAGKSLIENKVSKRDIEDYIIGTVGSQDNFFSPSDMNSVALSWYLSGQDNAFRQKIRDEVIGLSHDYKEEFSAFAGRSKGLDLSVAVLGGETLKAREAEFDRVYLI